MTLDREAVMNALNLESRRSTGSRILWGIGLALGGAVIGAGIALLLAPKPGTELRKDLLQGAKALVEPKENGATSDHQVHDHTAA